MIGTGFVGPVFRIHDMRAVADATALSVHTVFGQGWPVDLTAQELLDLTVLLGQLVLEAGCCEPLVQLTFLFRRLR